MLIHYACYTFPLSHISRLRIGSTFPPNTIARILTSNTIRIDYMDEYDGLYCQWNKRPRHVRSPPGSQASDNGSFESRPAVGIRPLPPVFWSPNHEELYVTTLCECLKAYIILS